jgi:C-terminal processing protease CtpA/Prc
MLSSPTAITATLFAALTTVANAQQPARIDSFSLDKAEVMLRTAKSEVQKNYYDPKFHGVDIEARYKEYEARLPKTSSLNEGMRVIAAFLEGLHDSHTFFFPPGRPYTVESGFAMEMFGNVCLVSRVRPGSDAADKLHPGDRILKFNGFEVNRDDFHDLEYYFNILNPATVFELDVRSPEGAERHMSVKAITHDHKQTINLSDPDSSYWDMRRRGEDEDHLYRSIVVTQGSVVYWKLPLFNLNASAVDFEFEKIKKGNALVLDLRGNPGGAVDTLKAIIGNLFDHDVKIADRVTRKETKAMIAKPRGGHPFAGTVTVLVDSGSASCSELFSRVMQLEHRGTVIGDTTAGAVMESLQYTERLGGDLMSFYGLSITEADLIMTDGKSLENVGVVPDQTVRPTPKALAIGVDVTLAKASAIAGGTLTAETAAKLFPYEWKPL